MQATSTVTFLPLLTLHNELNDSDDSLFILAITSAAGVDTVPGIISDRRSAAVSESVVVGLAFDSVGRPHDTFRYSLQARNMRLLPLPPGYAHGPCEIAFSPSGQYAAYVGFRGDSAVGWLRAVDGWSLLLETPGVPIPESDMLVGTATWQSASDFEIFLAPELSDGTWWFRYTGRVGSPTLRLDTLHFVPPPAAPPN